MIKPQIINFKAKVFIVFSVKTEKPQGGGDGGGGLLSVRPKGLQGKAATGRADALKEALSLHWCFLCFCFS